MSAPEIIGLVLLGLLAGSYAGAIGAGGGFVILPLLLWRHSGAPPEAITAASLSVAALLAGASAGLGLRDGRVDRGLVLVLAAVAIAGALIGAALTTTVPRQVFALGFATLLLLAAAYLLWRPVFNLLQPGARGWLRNQRDAAGARFLYRVPLPRALPAAFGISTLAAMAGIGGGILLVPVATGVMRMPHWLAVPTAHSVVFLVGVSGAGFQMAMGNADWSSDGPMADALWLGIGVLLSVPAGRWLNRRLGEGRLMRLLALGMIVVAVQTILSEA